jgi:hypothetical protein
LQLLDFRPTLRLTTMKRTEENADAGIVRP